MLYARGDGSNAGVLGYYVKEKKLIRLEDAIREMTSLPAEIFHIKNRVFLTPGYYADIIIFDRATVKDQSTYIKNMLIQLNLSM